MYRKEFFLLLAAALMLFAVVATISSMMTRALQHEAQMVVTDTLPGLINSGTAMSRMSDNWQNIRLLTELPNAAARSNLIVHIHTNSTEKLWKQYAESLFDPQDKLLFERTLTTRSNCLVLVQTYYQLVNDQKLEEARQYRTLTLEPMYREYKEDAKSLFELNTAVGEQRARHIITLTRWLPWLAGLFFVLVFAFGVVVGLKGAFGSLVFASRRREAPKKN